MSGYVVDQPHTLKAGEKISVRVDHGGFGVRTPPGSTALVYLNESRPETLITVAANTNRILICPAPYPCWASVEAVGGFVIINDPAGTGVPDFNPHWW
ncbi:hypothetical protein ABIB83_007518 [Bradyrhizobium sp. I1.8.5]|uniref:hypothetical protein n=1 Tax=Bradyrhizobium sp. I1.8.5 TaxID=3156365 RepID=UPI003399CE59